MANNIFADLSKSDIPCKLYHGTSDYLKLNKSDVLLPPNISNVLSEIGRKRNLDLVFLTPNFNYAKIYAGRATRKFGGKPVIFEIKPVGAKIYKSNDGDTIITCEHGYIIQKFELSK